ncbi:hypothetical protein C6P40_000476 [Pichia californica]|uniref:Uncharacterized protein n=1 Tax=Pichia californica TaxID=460514 RepID=A0A9P7BIF8_9ASCO|nr:hypothetical protein C6P42_001868 [[Candida] californica]KAG0690978.1 hypothetical protein C6P40_000476 [[Candida] californica]
MSMSLKRRITSAQSAQPKLVKRKCLKKITKANKKSTNNSKDGILINKLCSYKNNVSSVSSSEEDDDDSDIDASDRSKELKVKSLRFANSIDSKLSKAVSQYSDDDDDQEEEEEEYENDNDNEDVNDNESHSSTSSEHTLINESMSRNSDINGSNRSNSMGKKRNPLTNDILNVNYVSGHGLLNNKRYSVNLSDVVSSIPNNSNNQIVGNDNFYSFNITNKSPKHGNIPRYDFIARSRCFEYLVGAIDEAWARYCDSTSYDEDLAYGFDNSQRDETGTSSNVANTPNSNTYTSDDDEGYKTEFSATTTVTEYDSDFHFQNNNKPRSFSMINNTLSTKNNNNNMKNTNRRVSEVPENVRLQELKDRFTKSKYYLEDLVDSDLYNDCLAFWAKWDLIKYSIVDFVEEDEEDDDIERKIDELESGRFAGSYVN